MRAFGGDSGSPGAVFSVGTVRRLRQPSKPEGGGAGSGGADVFLVELAAGGATVLVDGESISSPVAKVTDEFNI